MPIEDVFDLGEHLRDGLWRVGSASLGDLRGVPGVALAGEPEALAAARLALAGLSKPVTFGEPPAEGALVVCLSYDGHDPSALEALAGARGPVVAATTGGPLAAQAREAGQKVVPIPAGFTPRSAVGYWVAITCELLARAGAQPSREAEIEAAAEAVEELASRWSGPDVEAAELAETLDAARALVLGDEDSALRRALSVVLLLDAVTFHLGSLARI